MLKHRVSSDQKSADMPWLPGAPGVGAWLAREALISLVRQRTAPPRLPVTPVSSFWPSIVIQDWAMTAPGRDLAFWNQFRAGAPEALAAVYWEYVGKVEGLIRGGFSLRGGEVPGAFRPDELADLVQEVFVRAFSAKGRRAYDGVREYGLYLYAIARHILVDWARARGREVPTPSEDIEAVIGNTMADEPSVPWAAPATVRVVEEYLRSIPSDLREVHRLRHEMGLSQEQAALRLGIGRQTLRTLERRLRDGLAATLEVYENPSLANPIPVHPVLKNEKEGL